MRGFIDGMLRLCVRLFLFVNRLRGFLLFLGLVLLFGLLIDGNI